MLEHFSSIHWPCALVLVAAHGGLAPWGILLALIAAFSTIALVRGVTVRGPDGFRLEVPAPTRALEVTEVPTPTPMPEVTRVSVTRSKKGDARKARARHPAA